MAVAVMVDDLRAEGLGDADAQRVADAMDTLGRYVRRWPKVREVIDAMAPRPSGPVDLGVDPPWLAKLKHELHQREPWILARPGEEAHAYLARTAPLRTELLARARGPLAKHLRMRERVPGEDDDL